MSEYGWNAVSDDQETLAHSPSSERRNDISGEVMKRAITPTEHMVVSRMIEKLPGQQRDQLLADLKNATAEAVNADGSIVRFEIAGYERTPSIGRHTSVDGVAKDGDGAHLNVILFTDLNGRLYELEIVRFEDGAIVGPDWTTLQLY